MSTQRWHNKYHGPNHWTIPLAGFPDSGTDPIASPTMPFQGPFCVNGPLSTNTGIISPVSYVQQLSTGGIAYTVISAFGNYNVLPTDFTIFANGGSGSGSIVTLPPASAVPNQEYIFKRTSSTSSVTLSVGHATDLIEQTYSSILLNAQYTVVILLSYQSSWWIIYSSLNY